MEEDSININYSPIRYYDFSHWFEVVEHNGKTLSESERKELVTMINETISQFSSGLPLIQDILDSSRNHQDEYHNIEYTIATVLLFTTITMTDCIVASKYFLIADSDYDRRFMRGKMKVILNEGFKRLYGFEAEISKKAEWSKLKPIMPHFPPIIQNQYTELTWKLDEHSKSHSWWRNERNLETHLEAIELYHSREEEIIESKVMMDSLRLFNTLMAVNEFLGNAHAYHLNFLVEKYYQGELTPEQS